MNMSMNVAPEFTDEQKKSIVQSVSRKVALTICRIEDKIQKEELNGAGDFPVYGAFVSLKRFRQLRACCGCMGDSIPLADALEQAAYRAAVDDIRFPPIENYELNDLEMEIWILFSPELVGAKGEDRQNYVEIGKHGLMIVKGEHRGLLLPGVATEMNLNPVTFLEQCCLKARIPKDAWKEDGTMLFRFQGMMFPAHLRDSIPENIAPQVLQVPQGPTKSDLAKLADHCYRNINKQFEGKVPDFYLPGAYDGKVNGVCLRVRLDRISADCAQLYLNDPQPLQSTLLGLSQNASLAMRQNNLGPSNLQKTALCVFWDVKALGSVEKVDVTSYDTRHTGFIAVRFGKWTLGFAPGKRPEAILEDIMKSSEFENDESTLIFAASVACTDIAFMTSTVQKPLVKNIPRSPAVAGMFYPSKPEELEAQRDAFLSKPPAPKQNFAGALVPHAGWKYSGPLMARTLEQIEFGTRIFIFAPKHHAIGVDWAVCPAPRWNLPGRPMEGDVNLSQSLVEAVPHFQLDSLAHDREHSIEVLLPFLAKLTPGSHVVGAVLQGGDRVIAETAKQLAEWIGTLPQRPTLIASSDMNHYATLEETLRVDAPVIEAMQALNPEEMLEIVRKNNVSMCGVLPCALVMMTLRELGLLNECVTVGCATSADGGGNPNSVVGYCGMLFR